MRTMTRLAPILALLAACTSSAPEPEPIPPADGPNLLLINADDLWTAAIGEMPAVRSHFASEGIEFTNSFVSTPLCCPSRATLLTGQYPHRHGVLDRTRPDGGARDFEDEETLAVWLHRAGYRTSLVGKYLNEYQKLPAGYIPPGWDDWHALVGGAEGSSTADTQGGYRLNEDGTEVTYGTGPRDQFERVITERALAFVDQPADRPFFVYYNPAAPHPPAIPAAEDAGTFRARPLPRTRAFNEANVSDKPWDGRYRQLDSDQIGEVEELWRTSMESVRTLDRQVGRLLDGLATRGLLDETVVVFTSDHGFLWGEHRLLGKVWPYEESIRVPLLIRAPGFEAGRAQGALVTNADVAPTLLELAGAEPGVAPDGQSLVPLLRGDTGGWRDAVLIEYLGHLHDGFLPPRYSAVRTRRHLYAEYEDGGRELYDLRTDPFQLANLAGVPEAAEVEAGLRERLHALKP